MILIMYVLTVATTVTLSGNLTTSIPWLILSLLQVFLISSINHHVSILRLKVHKSYISFIETGEAPSQTQPTSSDNDSDTKLESPPWFVLELRRSKWYDIFSADDRVEVMRGIWGIMAWLMRGHVPEDKEVASTSKTVEGGRGQTLQEAITMREKGADAIMSD